jgi:hypothetical protein
LGYFCDISTYVAPLVSLDFSTYRCSFPLINSGNISFQLFHSLSRQLVFEAAAFKQPAITFHVSPSVASTAGGMFVEIFNISQSWVPNQCAFGTLLADYSCSGSSCGCVAPRSFESKVVLFQLKLNQTSVGNIPFSYIRPIECSEFFPVTVSSDVFVSITVVGQGLFPQTIALIGGTKCFSTSAKNHSILVLNCESSLDPGFFNIELTANEVEFAKCEQPLLVELFSADISVLDAILEIPITQLKILAKRKLPAEADCNFEGKLLLVYFDGSLYKYLCRLKNHVSRKVFCSRFCSK